jgi:transcriptional regulator with PAS, ATPase and Fis domain
MNVRELENVARRLALLTPDSASFKLKDVAEWLVSDDGGLESESAEAQSGRRAVPSYASAELEGLRAALERHRGNLTKAAEELGITRPRAYRMLKSEKSGR